MELDWAGEVQPFLIGEMGLREAETYNVTFVEWRAYLKRYRERILQGWRYVRFIAWRNELVSNIQPQFKKSTAEAFWPLEGDEKREVKSTPLKQTLEEGEEKELFRIIGNIGK